jgi:hypothetical protein
MTRNTSHPLTPAPSCLVHVHRLINSPSRVSMMQSSVIGRRPLTNRSVTRHHHRTQKLDVLPELLASGRPYCILIALERSIAYCRESTSHHSTPLRIQLHVNCEYVAQQEQLLYLLYFSRINKVEECSIANCLTTKVYRRTVGASTVGFSICGLRLQQAYLYSIS